MSKTCPSHKTNKTWPMVRLGDVCEVQRGGSPRPIKDYITDSTEGLNWIKIGDVEPAGKYITQTVEKIKASGLNKTRKVSAGDFLLSNSMSFGRPYILKIDGCIHDGWLVLKGFSKTFTEDFFYYLLRSPIVQEQFDKLAHGSTVRNLNTDVVSHVSLPLPPLSVQREIVARLERELAAVEKMKKGFEELAETARAEFKAELKEVFGEISRGGAEMRRLGEICELISDCPHMTAKDEGVGIPLIRTPNVGFTRLILAGVHRVSEDVYKQRTKRAIPLPGDLIFAREAPAGNVAVIQSGEKVCLGQRTVLLRLRKGCFSDYIAYSMLQPESQKILIQRSTGSTVAHVNVCDIKTFPIHIPPLAVQRQIVARLDAAKARAEKLEAKAREGVAVCVTMRKAILKESFA